jgi:hypothetical protein
MNSAKDFFNSPELAKEKCKKLAEDIDKSIEWESESVSDYSPGVVEDTEDIARQIFSPIHIDSDSGEVKTAAFDDVSNKGLSVNRKKFVTDCALHELGEKLAEKYNDSKPNSNRKYMGYVYARTENIRLTMENKIRVFTVYDTALKEIPHHADVCMLLHDLDESQNPPLTKKLARKARRLRLQRLFSGLNISC